KSSTTGERCHGSSLWSAGSPAYGGTGARQKTPGHGEQSTPHATSCDSSFCGIDTEALRGGREELRGRTQVPVAFLGTDMAHIDREVGQPCLHIDAFGIPAPHAFNRKGVAQGAETRATPCVRCPHA